MQGKDCRSNLINAQTGMKSNEGDYTHLRACVERYYIYNRFMENRQTFAPPLDDMNAEEFRRIGHKIADWIANYVSDD